MEYINIFNKKCYIMLMENNDIDGIYDIVMEYFKVLGQLLLIYSKNEGALNSKKLQIYFKGEGIEYII